MTRLVKYEPFEACPQFDACSVNDCPLDPAAELHGGSHFSRKDDPETRCRAHRSTRESVAVAFGYSRDWARTHREVRRDAKRAAWLALPLEERESRLKKLEAARDKTKGGATVPEFASPSEDDPGSEGGDSGGQNGCS
jgi:hypothetical protein